jgi:hypothetical protein
MKKPLGLFLLVSLAVPAVQAQSVADAARAARDRQQTPTAKKVITDEDMPTSARSGGSSGSDFRLGPDWEADIDRFRSTYSQLCMAGAQKSLTAAQKQQLEEAAQPLKARMDQEKEELKQVKAEVERMKSEEAAELAAAPDEAAKEAVRKHYVELLKPKQLVVAASLQRAGRVLTEVINVASQCLQQ